jgi:hypothetical protein
MAVLLLEAKQQGEDEWELEQEDETGDQEEEGEGAEADYYGGAIITLQVEDAARQDAEERQARAEQQGGEEVEQE